MTCRIRDATPDDAETIARFNAAMALETEGRRLPTDTVLAGVRAVLADPWRGRYWMACDDSGAIGQVMVTREWSDWRNRWFWWLQSVYVVSGRRREGIFGALFSHVRAAAREAGAAGLRLYVEHGNVAARATYAKLGMIDAGYAMLETELKQES